MAPRRETVSRLCREPAFNEQLARRAHTGVERGRSVASVEEWRIDRGLEVQAVMEVPQEDRRGPLILLIAARRAECQPGLAVASHHSGRQCGAGTLLRC